jgi:membrane protein implicated in regulation of membrane protease activity
MDFVGSIGAWWLVAAVLLGLAELVAPGVFMVFLATAAAITGSVVLLFPGIPVAVQLIAFAAWSAVTVMVGRRFYRDYPVDSTDPLLNDRVARLLGETVTVTHAIEGGKGRVQVGDGEWPARGVDAPVGARVRVTGGQGGTLAVEPITAIEGR